MFTLDSIVIVSKSLIFMGSILFKLFNAVIKLISSPSLKKDIFLEKGRVLWDGKSIASIFNSPNKYSKYFNGEEYFTECKLLLELINNPIPAFSICLIVDSLLSLSNISTLLFKPTSEI